MSQAIQRRRTSAREATATSPYQGHVTRHSLDMEGEEEEEGGEAERDFPAFGGGCVNVT